MLEQLNELSNIINTIELEDFGNTDKSKEKIKLLNSQTGQESGSLFSLIKEMTIDLSNNEDLIFDLLEEQQELETKINDKQKQIDTIFALDKNDSRTWILSDLYEKLSSVEEKEMLTKLINITQKNKKLNEIEEKYWSLLVQPEIATFKDFLSNLKISKKEPEKPSEDEEHLEWFLNLDLEEQTDNEEYLKNLSPII